jgi:SAM-dependent MidA family methyltransferase
LDAADEIRRAIRSAGGAIPFRTFMDLALYGEHGFYTGAATGQAGRRGDFLTSPEVGPLFGAVVARFLDAEFVRLGRPHPFTVIDAGAGPGTLARSVLAAHPECTTALRYVAVELSPAQRDQHPDGVESRTELPPGPIDGIVLANEFLDNLPFRLVVFDGAWREALVAEGRDGRFVEMLSPPLSPVPAALPARPAHGARAALQDDAAEWLAQATGLVRAGRVVAVDYARSSTAEMTARPWREWLRTYRRQLRKPDAVHTQSRFLRRWGIDELAAEGREAWARAAASPDLTAVTMRSRVREAETLLDPGGLGAFTVAEWIAA